jgi:hypothetical protein
MEKPIMNKEDIATATSKTNNTISNNSSNNKPPVFLSNPRPHLKRPLDTSSFPPSHPLAGLPLPSPTPYQQQQAARLQYYHTRPAAYVENPSFGLKDFELQDTLG